MLYFDIKVGECYEEGSIRLSDGTTSREGRVEICLNGYWGTVCSNGWDESDALVACKQAGYQSLSKPIIIIITDVDVHKGLYQ